VRGRLRYRKELVEPWSSPGGGEFEFAQAVVARLPGSASRNLETVPRELAPDPAPARRRLNRDRPYPAPPPFSPATHALAIGAEALLDDSPLPGSKTAAWKTCLWMSIAAHTISDLLSSTEADRPHRPGRSPMTSKSSTGEGSGEVSDGEPVVQGGFILSSICRPTVNDRKESWWSRRAMI
jgi:hypothetical protein